MEVALGMRRCKVKAAVDGGRSVDGSDDRGDTRGRDDGFEGWRDRLRLPSPRSCWEAGGGQGRGQAARGRVVVGGWRPDGRARSRGSFESPWGERAGESVR